MVVTHEFTTALDRRGVTPVVHAVQGDCNTRAVAVKLTAGGAPYAPPDGAAAHVAYRTPRGERGEYSVLPNGAAACSISGNVVTAILAPEVLTDAGLAYVTIVLQDNCAAGQRIGPTFCIRF